MESDFTMTTSSSWHPYGNPICSQQTHLVKEVIRMSCRHNVWTRLARPNHGFWYPASDLSQLEALGLHWNLYFVRDQNNEAFYNFILTPFTYNDDLVSSVFRMRANQVVDDVKSVVSRPRQWGQRFRSASCWCRDEPPWLR